MCARAREVTRRMMLNAWSRRICVSILFQIKTCCKLLFIVIIRSYLLVCFAYTAQKLPCARQRTSANVQNERKVGNVMWSVAEYKRLNVIWMREAFKSIMWIDRRCVILRQMLYLSRAPSAKRFDAENNVRREKREVEKWLREIMQTVAKLCRLHSQIADAYLFFIFFVVHQKHDIATLSRILLNPFNLLRNNVGSPNITSKT